MIRQTGIMHILQGPVVAQPDGTFSMYLDVCEEQMELVKLRSGRVLCPACGLKGVGYADHPHAFGLKDYGCARCRYCQQEFEPSLFKPQQVQQ